MKIYDKTESLLTPHQILTPKGEEIDVGIQEDDENKKYQLTTPEITDGFSKKAKSQTSSEINETPSDIPGGQINNYKPSLNKNTNKGDSNDESSSDEDEKANIEKTAVIKNVKGPRFNKNTKQQQPTITQANTISVPSDISRPIYEQQNESDNSRRSSFQANQIKSQTLQHQDTIDDLLETDKMVSQIKQSFHNNSNQYSNDGTLTFGKNSTSNIRQQHQSEEQKKPQHAFLRQTPAVDSITTVEYDDSRSSSAIGGNENHNQPVNSKFLSQRAQTMQQKNKQLPSYMDPSVNPLSQFQKYKVSGKNQSQQYKKQNSLQQNQHFETFYDDDDFDISSLAGQDDKSVSSTISPRRQPRPKVTIQEPDRNPRALAQTLSPTNNNPLPSYMSPTPNFRQTVEKFKLNDGKSESPRRGNIGGFNSMNPQKPSILKGEQMKNDEGSEQGLSPRKNKIGEKNKSVQFCNVYNQPHVVDHYPMVTKQPTRQRDTSPIHQEFKKYSKSPLAQSVYYDNPLDESAAEAQFTQGQASIHHDTVNYSTIASQTKKKNHPKVPQEDALTAFQQRFEQQISMEHQNQYLNKLHYLNQQSKKKLEKQKDNEEKAQLQQQQQEQQQPIVWVNNLSLTKPVNRIPDPPSDSTNNPFIQKKNQNNSQAVYSGSLLKVHRQSPY